MEQTAPLQDLTALVRDELDRVNRELLQDLAPAEADLCPLLEHIGRYRGKQLRPALVFLAGKAVGRLVDDHVAVAKVVELIHTATLVHDDILDGATRRRQLATINALRGSEISVLLGDYVYARAFNLSLQMEDLTCSRVLSEVTRVICQGEITQLVHRFDFDWTEERYLRVITDKTASLFAAAARLGGHYAGGTATQLAALDEYGRALGVAFQIVDDCLDLQGEEDVVGKSLGTDVDGGKLTLPLLYVLHTGADAEARLRRVMGRPRSLQQLASEFDLGAALEFSLERARQQVDGAVRALEALPPTPAREALQELAQYVVRRDC